MIAWTPRTWRVLALVMWWMAVMWWLVCESEGRAEDNPAASPSACLLLLAGFPMLGCVCSPTAEGSGPWTPTPLCLLFRELTRRQGGPSPKEQAKVRLAPAQGLADAPSPGRVRPAVPHHVKLCVHPLWFRVWCPCRAFPHAEQGVESCPKTVSVLYDPKSQFMTPSLGSWFVLHHGGVSMELSCLLPGKGLNLSQELQALVTGSSLATTSAPSNHRYQILWPR